MSSKNLGDGTYNHSGSLAIRAALAAGTNITYKILFNDAVAMTGGQSNEGGLTAPQIVREIRAMGVNPVVVVYDEAIDLTAFPSEVEKVERAGLMPVQERLAGTPGVSAIVYVQTCAAESAAAASAAPFPTPTRGCSSTPMSARAAAIAACSRTACRSCRWRPNSGPSAPSTSPAQQGLQLPERLLSVLRHAQRREGEEAATTDLTLPDLPAPVLPEIRGTHNLVITGVGGTGVVTVGAVLAMAAHIDGKGAGMMEMAGLAQKGGAVHIHLRGQPPRGHQRHPRRRGRGRLRDRR